MKRDMDIIRSLLRRIEADEDLAIPEYSQKELLYHLTLMAEAGLIVADVITGQNGETGAVTVHRLTWAGHDFVSATKDFKLWTLAKEQILKSGASWTFQTLMSFLTKELPKHWP